MNEKHWTREFVAALWHNGGFESIAELHNRQLEHLAFRTPLRAVDVVLVDQSVCRARPCEKFEPLDFDGLAVR
jgi:hypothetical protein